MTDSAFWQGRPVLITGHTGFKGSWLSLWLQSLGARVTGYALPAPTNPSLFEAACVSESMASITGDVRDLAHLKAVIAESRPQIIVHMAAQSLVQRSYARPAETYEVNVMGTVNLLEAVRNAGTVKVVINVTTDKCYENREWVWGYRENEPMGGYDPYSSSKACSELVTAAYRNSYFNPADFVRHGVALASVRAGNVIGGGDWAPDRLIPDVLRAILAGHPAVIRNPHAVRPWQHVLEPLAGYLLLAQNLWEHGPLYAEAWNFGPDEKDARPVSEVVEMLTRDWGEQARWAVDGNIHPHEANYLKLDCSKAKARLGWRPKWGLEEAVSAIVTWHRFHRRGSNVREVCLSQIEEYVAALPARQAEQESL